MGALDVLVNTSAVLGPHPWPVVPGADPPVGMEPPPPHPPPEVVPEVLVEAVATPPNPADLVVSPGPGLPLPSPCDGEQLAPCPVPLPLGPDGEHGDLTGSCREATFFVQNK